MEAVNEDDEAMMAIMGMTGFGSTKVIWPLRPYRIFSIVTLAVRVSTSLEIKTARPM
jgi:hypothetical protein